MAEPAEIDANAPKLKTFATGGRKRSRSVGEFLTGMLLIGRVSGHGIQEGAIAASSNSTCSNPLLRDLAKSGSSGKYKGNIHRDTINKLGKRYPKPDIYQSKVDLK